MFCGQLAIGRSEIREHENQERMQCRGVSRGSIVFLVHTTQWFCCHRECAGVYPTGSTANEGHWRAICSNVAYFSDPDHECLNGGCDGSGQCTDPGTA